MWQAHDLRSIEMGVSLSETGPKKTATKRANDPPMSNGARHSLAEILPEADRDTNAVAIPRYQLSLDDRTTTI
jgi:hypothetical protein